MGLLLKQLFQFLKLLNSDTGTNQLAAGLSLGIILGFSPFFSLQVLLVFFILFFFRVQMGAAFLGGFFFKFIAFLLDPLCDAIGRWALELPALKPTWTLLYNMPIIPFTRFNDSIVMGSGIIGFVLAVPMFFVFKKLILKYRELVVQKIKGTKVWKALTATTFYKWYVKYDDLYGA